MSVLDDFANSTGVTGQAKMHVDVPGPTKDPILGMVIDPGFQSWVTPGDVAAGGRCLGKDRESLQLTLNSRDDLGLEVSGNGSSDITFAASIGQIPDLGGLFGQVPDVDGPLVVWSPVSITTRDPGQAEQDRDGLAKALYAVNVSSATGIIATRARSIDRSAVQCGDGAIGVLVAFEPLPDLSSLQVQMAGVKTSGSDLEPGSVSFGITLSQIALRAVAGFKQFPPFAILTVGGSQCDAEALPTVGATVSFTTSIGKPFGRDPTFAWTVSGEAEAVGPTDGDKFSVKILALADVTITVQVAVCGLKQSAQVVLHPISGPDAALVNRMCQLQKLFRNRFWPQGDPAAAAQIVARVDHLRAVHEALTETLRASEHALAKAQERSAAVAEASAKKKSGPPAPR
jgi:hypothetical protein